MKSQPDLLTTVEAAKICGFSQQIIIDCIDKGILKGTYNVPDSSHRRIPRACLEDFMKDEGIPDCSKERLFTTGEAAKICNISQQQIIRYFNKGVLGGYRIPINGKFRKIPRSCLVKFMEDNGIPTDLLPPEEK